MNFQNSIEFVLIFLASLCILVQTQYNYSVEDNERILRLSVSKPWEIIEYFGYPIENHNITTRDGYILSVQRIPYGKNRKKSKKPPMLFLTGLWADSRFWVIDEENLAYKLADLGYDVWMLNNRGTVYSTRHTYLDPDSSRYWNFSFHEMGIYDAPDTIDYILEKTKHKSLYCLGFSQGGAILSIMLSKLPEYNEKVRLVVYYGPGTYVKNTLYLAKFLTQNGLYKSEEFVEKNGHYGMFLGTGLLQPMFVNQFCKSKTGSKLCATVVMYLVGPNYSNINWKILPVFGSHYPGGASIKQLLHFCQFIKTGDFAEYANYKELFSLSYKPKLYNISAISAPTALFYGKNDWLVSASDMEKFSNQLPNLIMKHLVKDPYFNHIDFLAGLNKYEMVEKHVIALIKKF